ncbi:hypothetical protein AWN68_00165 [Roseivirga echinicomitans]|uniref:Uncharacterized protein n=1 Tax=Roseivirga echinicomitans TaxID=296218 RepID=A0A150XX95_9BACT|nr:hypothetical protein AWN68_00165 [Roseivirga echinicomitans]
MFQYACAFNFVLRKLRLKDKKIELIIFSLRNINNHKGELCWLKPIILLNLTIINPELSMVEIAEQQVIQTTGAKSVQ